MLLNGLGNIVDREVLGAKRFVDLFAGSCAVAFFVATRHRIEVRAFDLQEYSVALASSVISRTQVLDAEKLLDPWILASVRIVMKQGVPDFAATTRGVADARKWCAQAEFPITRSYGGYYFSPIQAVWLDALRATVSKSGDATAALAALIDAASQCSASPGHTAQPFQPTDTGLRSLQEAWARDIVRYLELSLKKVCGLRSLKKGYARCLDANLAAETLKKGDLVFVDPPYSGVHYSRFYHVLETIAQGECGDVAGSGRYPAPEFRPRSRYSVLSQSKAALDELLDTLARKQVNVLLTFPDHVCSNGLSGADVQNIARSYFKVDRSTVATRFSTLGGRGNGAKGDGERAARQQANEMILLLQSK